MKATCRAHRDIKAQIAANWVYLGSEEAGRAALAPILDLNPPTLIITEVPWNEVYYSAGFGYGNAVCEKGVVRNLYTVNVRSISALTYDLAFASMEAFYAAFPNGRESSIQFEIFPNQAMLDVPDDSTAYPWRDTIGYM